MTRTLIPLREKVIGTLEDGFGLKRLSSGLIINEKDGDEKNIRARWFKVTHVGPEQRYLKLGDWVLVAHGRWSRGFTIDNEDKTKYYHLDTEEILMVSDVNPMKDKNEQ